MNKAQLPNISIVVPLYNESRGLQSFHTNLVAELNKLSSYNFEIIYCDDGSTDHTAEAVKGLNFDDFKIKLIKLSRNFGKENALTACIAQAHGDAIIMIDGDGQHPQTLIPKFINAWENGAKVVVGVRTNNKSSSLIKKVGSWTFYRVFNKITGQKLIVGSTDFRLIDKSVQKEFLKLNETNRVTKALIDWLGFKREYIYFEANDRIHGEPGYSTKKLAKLAVDSFVSITPRPLYIFGYIGVAISFISFILGVAVIIEQLILGDPWHWKFSGTAMLAIILVFLVGIVLMSQGILSLYISMLHNQNKQRPLYIIDRENSIGIKE